jgi:hypothetical protein
MRCIWGLPFLIMLMGCGRQHNVAKSQQESGPKASQKAEQSTIKEDKSEVQRNPASEQPPINRTLRTSRSVRTVQKEGKSIQEVEDSLSHVGGVVGAVRGGYIGIRGSTPATAPPPPPQTSSLTWNAWAEDSGEPFSPVDHLHPNTDYDLVLDLSAISYDLLDGGVSRAAGPGFHHQINDWFKDISRKDAVFKVLLLPDPAYFDNPTKRSDTLQFKLSRLKQPELLLADADKNKTPLQILRDKSEPSFRLGHVSFKIHTGQLQGKAAIGLSLWADGRRPVDELVVAYCISDDVGENPNCQPSTRGTVSLNGIDSVRLSAQMGDTGSRFPDAAVHFVRLDSDQVLGVFRRNDWEAGRFETWRLGRTAGQLREYFENTLLPAFSAATAEQELEARGTEFYNLLFPLPGPRDAADAGRARTEFETFVREHMEGEAASAREHLQTPSIFIRMLTQDDNSIQLVPLGLLAVKVNQGPPEFLGFHFRIETPLAIQNYQRSTTCISTWALAVPPARGDLQEMRTRFDESLTDFTKGAQYFYESMKDFGTYLGTGKEESAAAVAVLSHHNKNQIFFSSSDLILSTAVNRDFTKPSIAILDGCGTGSPGAVDFIDKLNNRGITSVIATSTEIRPEIAADFMRCLASELNEHRAAPDYRLSYAYLNTIECLKGRSMQEGGAKYGPLALTYSLLGNGDLKLCVPIKRPQ